LHNLHVFETLKEQDR